MGSSQKNKMVKGKVVTVQGIKACQGIRSLVSFILTLTLDDGEWLTSCPGCFTPGEQAPGTH